MTMNFRADPVPRHASSPACSRWPTAGSSRDAAPPTRAEPWWIEYPKSFFPVLLIVFLLRSFVAEPFKIPSSSMRPTLEVGDFILVNKFAYGLRLPIVEQKIIPIADPQRGDVVVFRYPVNPSQDFIKRVIGVAGDTVVYRDKQLTVNGKPLAAAVGDGTYSYLEGLRFETMEQFAEAVPPTAARTRAHDRRQPAGAGRVARGQVRPFPGRENCDYNDGAASPARCRRATTS